MDYLCTEEQLSERRIISLSVFCYFGNYFNMAGLSGIWRRSLCRSCVSRSQISEIASLMMVRSDTLLPAIDGTVSRRRMNSCWIAGSYRWVPCLRAFLASRNVLGFSYFDDDRWVLVWLLHSGDMVESGIWLALEDVNAFSMATRSKIWLLFVVALRIFDGTVILVLLFTSTADAGCTRAWRLRLAALLVRDRCKDGRALVNIERCVAVDNVAYRGLLVDEEVILFEFCSKKIDIKLDTVFEQRHWWWKKKTKKLVKSEI